MPDLLLCEHVVQARKICPVTAVADGSDDRRSVVTPTSLLFLVVTGIIGAQPSTVMEARPALPAAVQSRAFVIYVSGPSPEGKFYVGQTANFERRCVTHRKVGGECPQFHRALDLFGWDSMRPRIVEQTDIAEEADRLERLYISRYNALFPHGYNMTIGGRWATFDPSARVTSFQEEDVSEAELARQSERRLNSGACPICGEICRGCGIPRSFGKLVLEHILKNLPDAGFTLPQDPKTIRFFRDCPDADYLIRFYKKRRRVRTIAESAPIAAAEYFLRLAPYIRTSLKRDVLASKGVGSFNLGRWSALTRAERTGMDSIMAGERHIRRHKNDFFGSKIGRSNVIGQALAFYGGSEAKDAGVIQAAAENGASVEEIDEGKSDSLLLREIQAKCVHEMAEYQPPPSNQLPIVSFTEDGGLRINLSIGPPEPAMEAFWVEHLFADKLSSWHVAADGRPAIFILPHARPHLLLAFSCLAERRAEVRRLLKFNPRERMEEINLLYTSSHVG